jgi:hypothetical protein
MEYGTDEWVARRSQLGVEQAQQVLVQNGGDEALYNGCLTAFAQRRRD